MKRLTKAESKARQLNLFVDERSLFEKLCDLHNLQAGFKAVKENGGAPGVDGVTVEAYGNRLDELDKELERRGLEFCRFADDCNIFVRSPKAANRIMSSISKFIEKKLKLKINHEKSKVGRSLEVKFLGMTIIEGTVAISRQSMERAMAKVKELTPRGTHLSLEQTMKRINEWYKGWSGYYLMTQYPTQFVKIEAHIRRRLRSRIVDQQKRRRHLFKKLVKRGVSKSLSAKTVYTNNGRWVLSKSYALHKAFPNRWFTDVLGQWLRSTGLLKHWFGVHRWIRLS